MLEHDLIRLAKKKLLEKKYGMFDWLEKLLAEHDLLTQKPRLLREQIAIMLLIKIEDVPYKTFHSWIDRYRKKRQTHLNKNKEMLALNAIADDTWKNFKPTITSNKPEVASVLKKVKYEQ